MLRASFILLFSIFYFVFLALKFLADMSQKTNGICYALFSYVYYNLSFRIPCSFITYALLGSYIVQSELGDYCSTTHGDTGSEYLSGMRFAPESSPEELNDKVAELHRLHRS